MTPSVSSLLPNIISSDGLQFIKEGITFANAGIFLEKTVKIISDYKKISFCFASALSFSCYIKPIETIVLTSLLVFTIVPMVVQAQYEQANINQKLTYGKIIRLNQLNQIFPSQDISSDNIFDIFKKFHHQDLERCCQVSLEWNLLANDPSLSKEVIFQEFAVNPSHWNEIFGEGTVSGEELKKAFDLLPNNIGQILKMACPFFPNKRIRDTHMLVWCPESINGETLDVQNFGKLLKLHSELTDIPMDPNILKNVKHDKICSGWILMTNDVLPNSREKSHSYGDLFLSNQYKRNQPLYYIPKVGEALVSIVTTYLKSKKSHFSTDPLTYSKVNDKSHFVPIACVGGIHPKGIKTLRLASCKDIGLAPAWRLPDKMNI